MRAMHPLTAIAYVSSAVQPLSEDELEALLSDARRTNEEAGITGTLLYDDGSFFQYLEGPTAEAQRIYDRICRSSRHHGLIELLRRPVAQRHFDGWTMGFARAPRSVMLRLAQASWIEVVERSRLQTDPPVGVKLLLDFWRSTERR